MKIMEGWDICCSLHIWIMYGSCLMRIPLDRAVSIQNVYRVVPRRPLQFSLITNVIQVKVNGRRLCWGSPLLWSVIVRSSRAKGSYKIPHTNRQRFNESFTFRGIRSTAPNITPAIQYSGRFHNAGASCRFGFFVNIQPIQLSKANDLPLHWVLEHRRTEEKNDVLGLGLRSWTRINLATDHYAGPWSQLRKLRIL